MPIEITAIHMSDGGHDHEHIEEVAWRNDSTGATGSGSRATMVTFIDEKKNTVYVADGAKKILVGSVHPVGHPAYIRTYADGDWSNNLLALPRY